MSQSGLQNVKISCRGGIDLRSTYQELLGRPGTAKILENFECDYRGGYRRINGYTPYGTQIDDQGDIKGIHIFNNSVLVAKGVSLYHSFDGETWLKVNAEVNDKTTAEMELEIATDLNANAETYRFADYSHGDVTEAHYVTIVNGLDEVMVLKVVGSTSGTAIYSFQFLDPVVSGAPIGCHIVESFQDQIYLSGNSSKPSSVFVSTLFDPYTYTGTNSLEISTADPIVALQPFRENMVVFCQKSIFYMRNVNAGQPELQPITRRVGCVATDSVQEIAGDLVFLTREGVRGLAATERIGDVALPALSNNVQPLLEPLIRSLSQYRVTSTVLRTKNQYRLYFSHKSFEDFDRSHIGFIGTLFESEQGSVWNWSTTSGINSRNITDGVIDNNNISLMSTTVEEITFALSDGSELELSDGSVLSLGSSESLLHLHDSGSSFNGEAIKAHFKSHQTDLGDPSIRKNVHRVRKYFMPEGGFNLDMTLIFTGYGNTPEKSPSVYQIVRENTGSAYGSAVYGIDSYGTTEEINVVTNTEGSGFTIGFDFRTENNAPFNIQGWDLDFRPSGKV